MQGTNKTTRLHSVNDIINGDCQSAEVKQQCFVVENKKLVLKRTHSYFYQIQLQLLVTEARFCDFVFYSAKGPVSIERIYPDSKLQTRIVESTRSFWQKVYIPEYFLMQVSRDLLPVVISNESNRKYFLI